jgi:large subunit ribosomal protein L29
MMATGAAELRKLDAAELATQLANARQALFNLRFQLATRKLTNFNTLREARREVARILTVMGEADRGA